MKFYYNGVLVRTSKTHHYTHAAIREVNGKILVLCCSATKEGAQARKDADLANTFKRLDFFEKLQECRASQKPTFWSNYHTYRGKTDLFHTKQYDQLYSNEGIQKYIDQCRNEIKNYHDIVKVVELEER